MIGDWHHLNTDCYARILPEHMSILWKLRL